MFFLEHEMWMADLKINLFSWRYPVVNRDANANTDAAYTDYSELLFE
jgi:hypothetical protein